MAYFLITTLPMRGHITAALVVADKLVERGHEVAWYTGSRYRNVIERHGIRFFPYRSAYDFDDLDMNGYFPGRVGLRGIESIRFDYHHVFVEPAADQLRDLDWIVAQFPVDVILADFCFIGAGWFHEKGGPVWAALGHTPLTINSRDTGPFGLRIAPDSSTAGREQNQTLYQLRREVVFRDVIEYTDKVRLSLGLPAQACDPGEAVLSPYLFLQGCVPQLEYPRSDLPTQLHFVGPLLPLPAPEFELPSWWPELTQTPSRPVIHVTQGTVDTDPQDLLLPAIEALAHEDVLVIATTGGRRSAQSLGLVDPPANLRLESFVPHSWLLPQVDVMVTNGGYNGVLMALANGVPLVTSGVVNDKAEVGCRVEWAGVGINLRNPRPKSIQAAVRQILSETETRYRHCARQFQSLIAQYDAATTAALLLEQLASTKKSVDRGSVPSLMQY